MVLLKNIPHLMRSWNESETMEIQIDLEMNALRQVSPRQPWSHEQRRGLPK